jgi:N-methylhydantoinase B
MEITSPRPVTLVVLSQRLNFPPVGREGGENGSLEKILPTGDEVEGGPPFRLSKGDIITLDLPGGGGFGMAQERSPEFHEADVRDGLV